MKVPFNRPLILGSEQTLINEVFESGRFAGNGSFGSRCGKELEENFGYKKCLLTTSCTSALEFAALILDIDEGDEVIVPSYAFVTTANAFANRGAKIVFADSRSKHPNIDETKVEELISPKTKAIVALHYGGVSCEMDVLKAIADKYSIYLIEDNAQGIGSYYRGQPLGGIGTIGALSFHDTKNIHCGEGGAILVNDDSLLRRSEVVWDMGTNRKEFKDGKVNSYGWVDLGSSFYPSELNSAFLLAQLEQLEEVTIKRLDLWNNYHRAFQELEEKGIIELPNVPPYAEHNGHTFYLITSSKDERDKLISFLSDQGIQATFHFQSLHRSKYFTDKYKGDVLPNSDLFSNTLIRLPLFYGLEPDQERIIGAVLEYYKR
jgi:dTDP-4-amino-4,6-dideoxygalactose transaminase